MIFEIGKWWTSMEQKEMSRTKIHEHAMICIYQHLFYQRYHDDLIKKGMEEIISDVMEVPFDQCDPFFKAIVFETIQDKKEFIDIISTNLAKKWSFNRLNLTDQAILLLFTCEMLNKRVECQIAINEAIELAKKYCDDHAYRYINAVLDKIRKDYVK